MIVKYIEIAQFWKSIEEKFVLELGCALGAHAGPGALVVGFQELD